MALDEHLPNTDKTILSQQLVSSKEVYIDLSTYLMWYFAHNFAIKPEMKTILSWKLKTINVNGVS